MTDDTTAKWLASTRNAVQITPLKALILAALLTHITKIKETERASGR